MVACLDKNPSQAPSGYDKTKNPRVVTFMLFPKHLSVPAYSNLCLLATKQLSLYKGNISLCGPH